MKRLTQLLTFSALTATLAFSQGRGHGTGTPPDPAQMTEMRVNMLTRRLTLTDAQKAQATTIYTNSQTAAASLRTNLRTTMESLNEAVKANNTAGIDQLSATLGTTTGQLTSIERKADAQFYQILTAEQKAKYDEGRMAGPGGFGGGPRRFGRSPRNQ